MACRAKTGLFLVSLELQSILMTICRLEATTPTWFIVQLVRVCMFFVHHVQICSVCLSATLLTWGNLKCHHFTAHSEMTFWYMVLLHFLMKQIDHLQLKWQTYCNRMAFMWLKHDSTISFWLLFSKMCKWAVYVCSSVSPSYKMNTEHTHLNKGFQIFIVDKSLC